MKRTQPNTIIIGAIILAGLAGLLIYHNRIFMSDWFSSLSYASTPEMDSLESSIGLTDSAKLILHASHPSLKAKDDFNELCDSHDSKISILGCYTNNRIYLYDLNEEDLAGIKESTLAHELLHAVWDRLSGSEKDRLSEKLTEVYNDERYNSLLSENLEIYDESERMGELHSRIGTQIVELPEELESHYAKYFENQNNLVLFFNEYITPFRELEAKIKELSGKIESISSDINEKVKTYYNELERLSREVDMFNECASTAGCYTDQEFQETRSNLVSRRDALAKIIEDINSRLDERNAIADEYNESLVRGEALENLINSNADLKNINIKESL